MERSRKIILFILYYILYVGLVQRYLFSHELLKTIPDILIFYCGYLTFNNKTRSQRISLKYYIGKGFLISFGLLLLIGTFSAIYNEIPLLTFLWGLKMYVRYVLLVWVIYENLEVGDVHKYKRILYTAFDVNMLVCLFQFFQDETGDRMGGLFLHNGPLMLMCFITFILYTADYLNGEKSLISYIIRISGMMMIAIFAEIKMMYFLFPLTFYMCYVVYKRFDMSHIILLVLAYFLLIPTMQYFISLYYDSKYATKVFNEEYIEKETHGSYGFKKGGFNRATAIEFTSVKMLNDSPKRAFGYGLGSGTTSTFFKTPLFDKYSYTSYWNFSTSYCLVEIGWIGFILYAQCILFLLYAFFRAYKNTPPPIVKYWAAIGVISTAATYILAWYDDGVYYQYLPMCFLWGICWLAISEGKEENLNLEEDDTSKSISYSPGL